MKILICSNVYPPNFIGGAEIIAHQQALALKNLGNEVVVFAGDPPPYGHPPNGPRYAIREERYEGVRVYRTCLEAIDYISDYVNFCHLQVEKHFIEILEKFQPDIVHCHNIIGLSIGILGIAQDYGAKVILTAHDHWTFCLKNTLIYQDNLVCSDFSRCQNCLPSFGEEGKRYPIRLRIDYLKSQLQYVDIVITPSQYLANAYIKSGFPAAKIKVINNGVSYHQFSKIVKKPDLEKVRFTCIGYLADHKGISVLLDSLAFLGNLKHKVFVNIVGIGPLADHYLEKIRGNGDIGQVKFWGRVENQLISEVYRNTDVYVLPSIWPENQPVTITEALASGIPVIGSNIGGVPELIVNGETGFLFNPGDPEMLAELMLTFIRQPSLIEKLGSKGRQRMENNDFTVQAIKIQDVYQETISNGAAYNDIRANNLIVCIGSGVDAAGFELMSGASGNYQFIMEDWLSIPQIKSAQAALVVNNSASTDQLFKSAINKLPILIPEMNKNLVDSCCQYRYGLYYNGVEEALACINYLSNNTQVSEKLRHNAFQWALNSARNQDRTSFIQNQ